MAAPVTIEDIYELFRRSQAEADRRAAEVDWRLKQLEHIAANTSFEMVGLMTHWDLFMDNLVGPAMVRLFQEWGIEV